MGSNSKTGLWMLGGAAALGLVAVGALGGVLLFRQGGEPPPLLEQGAAAPETFAAADPVAAPPAPAGEAAPTPPPAPQEAVPLPTPPVPAPPQEAKVPPAPVPPVDTAGAPDADATGDGEQAAVDQNAEGTGAQEAEPAPVVFDEALARRAAAAAATTWLTAWDEGARDTALAQASLDTVRWNGVSYPVRDLVAARQRIATREVLSYETGLLGAVTADGVRWQGVVRTTNRTGQCRIDAVVVELAIPPSSPIDGSTWRVAGFSQASVGTTPHDSQTRDTGAALARWHRVQGDVVVDRWTGLQWNRSGTSSVPAAATDLAASRNGGERDLACAAPNTRWAQDAVWRPPTLAEWDSLTQAVADEGRRAGRAAPQTTDLVWVQDPSGRMMRYDPATRSTAAGEGPATVMLVREVAPESLFLRATTPLVIPPTGTIRRVGQ